MPIDARCATRRFHAAGTIPGTRSAGSGLELCVRLIAPQQAPRAGPPSNRTLELVCLQATRRSLPRRRDQQSPKSHQRVFCYTSADSRALISPEGVRIVVSICRRLGGVPRRRALLEDAQHMR